MNKTLPNAVEVEFKIIGAMLVDPDSILTVQSHLRPGYFFDNRHKIICEAIYSLFDDNIPVDTVSLYEWLNKQNKLDICGGLTFISKFSQDVSSSANVDYHCKVVLEKHLLRKMLFINDKINSAIYNNEDVFQILNDAQTEYLDIDINSTNEDLSVSKQAKLILQQVKDIKSGESPIVCYKTGFRDYDDIYGGFFPGDLIFIAGRPAMGKTAVEDFIANSFDLRGEATLEFNLEMTSFQRVQRTLSAKTSINMHNIRMGKVDHFEEQSLEDAVNYMNKSKRYIYDKRVTIDIIRSVSRSYKKKYDIKAVFIDYLQLMRGEGQNREREIGNISMELKALAKELNLPVICLSQLNRAVEYRQNKRPMLADLRESGQIEQDADTVIFLYRDEVYGILIDQDGNETKNIMELIVAKQRNNRLATIKVLALLDTFEFKDLDDSHQMEIIENKAEEYPI